MESPARRVVAGLGALYAGLAVLGYARLGLEPVYSDLTKDMTVLQAISLAGGFTKYAQRNGVKVMRDVDGEQEIHRVRVAEISKTGDRSNDVLLQSGDIVFVPESLF